MAATFGHPNILAAYLNLLLPLALLAWHAASGRVGRTVLTLWFALTLAALYLTSSRGGLGCHRSHARGDTRIVHPRASAAHPD